MSDIWAGVIGAAVGILVAPMCALLIVALLRERQVHGRWLSISSLAPPALPAPPERLALPSAKDLQ